MTEVVAKIGADVLYRGFSDLVSWASDKIALATEDHNFYIFGKAILFKIDVKQLQVYPATSVRVNYEPRYYQSLVSFRQPTVYSTLMYFTYFTGGNPAMSQGFVLYTVSLIIDLGRPSNVPGATEYIDKDTYRTVTIWFLYYKPQMNNAGFQTVGQFSYRWTTKGFEPLDQGKILNRSNSKDSFGVARMIKDPNRMIVRLYLGTSNTLVTCVFATTNGVSMQFDANIEQGTVAVDGLLLSPFSDLRSKRGGVHTFTADEDKQRIQIASTTDFFSGNSLSQSTFTFINDGVVVESHARYPIAFGKYVLDVNKIHRPCTPLVGKTNSISAKDFPLEVYEDTLGRITLYGLLRYFLWYLIKGRFTLQILQNKYTILFFQELAASKYAGFIKAFESDELKGLNVYFIESL